MKKFKNTSEVEPYDGIIGQERAVSAMQLGLQMNNPAYNIYVSGNCGSGRITYTIKAIESQQIDESKINTNINIETNFFVLSFIFLFLSFHQKKKLISLFKLNLFLILYCPKIIFSTSTLVDFIM